MTIVVGIAIDAEDFAIGQVLSCTTTTIELTQFVPVDGQMAPYFWKDIDDDDELDTFERQVRANDRVESLTQLDGRVNAHLYRIDWADYHDDFLAALHDHDVLVKEGRTTNDGKRWLFRFRVADQEALTAFQTACATHDVPLDVRRVYEAPDEHPDEVEQLTAAQREAIVVALQHGYFDIPRDYSQQEVAEELDISRQAFSRRLRRAERNVFEDLLWQDLVDAESI